MSVLVPSFAGYYTDFHECICKWLKAKDRGLLKIKCAYYASSNATVHLILDVGDLVFKLNLGTDNRITTIVKNCQEWSPVEQTFSSKWS